MYDSIKPRHQKLIAFFLFVLALHPFSFRGCLLAVFKEKPAELAISPELSITSKLVPPLPVYPSVMMSAKRCGLAALLFNIRGLPPNH